MYSGHASQRLRLTLGDEQGAVGPRCTEPRDPLADRVSRSSNSFEHVHRSVRATADPLGDGFDDVGLLESLHAAVDASLGDIAELVDELLDGEHRQRQQYRQNPVGRAAGAQGGLLPPCSLVPGERSRRAAGLSRGRLNAEREVSDDRRRVAGAVREVSSAK